MNLEEISIKINLWELLIEIDLWRFIYNQNRLEKIVDQKYFETMLTNFNKTKFMRIFNQNSVQLLTILIKIDLWEFFTNFD